MRFFAFLLFLITLSLSSAQANLCEIAMLSQQDRIQLEALKSEQSQLAEFIQTESSLIERGLNLKLASGQLSELMLAHKDFLTNTNTSKSYKDNYHRLLLNVVKRIDQGQTQKSFEKIISTTEKRIDFLTNMEANSHFPVLLMKTLNDFIKNEPPIREYHFWNTLLNHYKNIELARAELKQLKAKNSVIMEHSQSVQLKKELNEVQVRLTKELLKSTNNNKALSNLSRIREKTFALRLNTPRTEKQRQEENQELQDLKLEFDYQLAEITLHRRIEENSNGALSKSLLELHTKSKDIKDLIIDIWETTPQPQSPLTAELFKTRRRILEQLQSE